MVAVTALLAVALLSAPAPGEVAEVSPCSQGEVLFSGGDFVAAQDALWKCSLAGNATQDQGLHLAWTYRELRNYAEGFTRVSEALKTQPSDENLLYLAAFLRFRQRRLEESVGFLNRAYKLQPDDWRVHQLYALNFVEVGWAGAVEQELKRAIGLKPDMPELYYQLARYYYTMDKFEEAITASQKALELAPDYASVYDNLGLCYAGLSDAARATVNFSKAIEINAKRHSRDEWPLIDYGAFLEGQDLTKASAVLRDALQMDPANATANYELGRTMQRLGRDAEAEHYLAGAIKLDPDYTSAYWILSTLTRKRGDRALAATYLDEFQRLKERDKKDGTSETVLSLQHR
ncbi:MAG: tetratricopeptide repeat protein [Acidobacteriaceae bacterium]